MFFTCSDWVLPFWIFAPSNPRIHCILCQNLRGLGDRQGIHWGITGFDQIGASNLDKIFSNLWYHCLCELCYTQGLVLATVPVITNDLLTLTVNVCEWGWPLECLCFMNDVLTISQMYWGVFVVVVVVVVFLSGSWECISVTHMGLWCYFSYGP